MGALQRFLSSQSKFDFVSFNTCITLSRQPMTFGWSVCVSDTGSGNVTRAHIQFILKTRPIYPPEKNSYPHKCILKSKNVRE